MSPDVVVVPALASPALFGKLPGHGDFVSRGIAGVMSERIDRWLSNWLKLGRAQLLEEFDQRYLEACPWLWANGSTSAVLMPSVDAVGRQYPVLVFCAAGTGLQAIYDLMVEALAEGWTSAALLDALATLEAGPLPADDRGWFLPEGVGATLPRPCAAEGWSEMGAMFQ